MFDHLAEMIGETMEFVFVVMGEEGPITVFTTEDEAKQFCESIEDAKEVRKANFIATEE